MFFIYKFENLQDKKEFDIKSIDIFTELENLNENFDTNFIDRIIKSLDFIYKNKKFIFEEIKFDFKEINYDLVAKFYTIFKIASFKNIIENESFRVNRIMRNLCATHETQWKNNYDNIFKILKNYEGDIYKTIKNYKSQANFIKNEKIKIDLIENNNE